jgi:tRNA A37 threonylcarbamoyladenosine modification protein TsaB
MIILSLRTDKPEAEIGLFEKNIELAYEVWQAHRALAETIHAKIDEILNKNNKSLKEVNAGIRIRSSDSRH